MRLGQCCYYLIIIGVVSFAFVLGAFFFAANHKCVDFSALERYQTNKPSIILDADGNIWDTVPT